MTIARLHQFSKIKPCYYCGAPAPPPSTREHAPPKMMFSGFDCDSITVPACDKHNTQKSIGDRAIVTAAILGAYQMWKYRSASANLTSNVVKAIKISEPDFQQAQSDVSLRDFLFNPPPELDIPLPYIRPGINVEGWIRHLTAALVWSVAGKYDPHVDWDKAWAWSPGFTTNSKPIELEDAELLFLRNQGIKQKLDDLIWHSGWSAKPREYPADIYLFEVSFIEKPDEWDGMEVIFRHRFYNNTSVWYAVFSASSETKTCLMKMVGERTVENAG